MGTTAGQSVGLWSYDELLNVDLPLLGNVANVGAWGYLGYSQQPGIMANVAGLQVLVATGPRVSKASKSAEIVNIDLFNSISLLSTTRKNIRCVRNTAWNPNAAGYNPEPNYGL